MAYDLCCRVEKYGGKNAQRKAFLLTDLNRLHVRMNITSFTLPTIQDRCVYRTHVYNFVFQANSLYVVLRLCYSKRSVSGHVL